MYVCKPHDDHQGLQKAKDWGQRSFGDEVKKSGDENVPNQEIMEHVTPSQPITSMDLVLDSEGDMSAITTSPKINTKIKVKTPRIPPNLWHLRLGHASRSTLSHIPQIKATFDSNHCQACILGKSTKTPYYADEFTANHKIVYIHSDTCGPFPASFSRLIYYITFVCDHTRHVWVYPLPNKKAATIKNIFAKWKAEVELESGYKIKCIRTDGGGEYKREMTTYFESIGIKHLLTAPYNPQSNGVAERLNRTLIDMMRTILINGNMPHEFWAEALVHAAYIKNRLPTGSLKDYKTPYETYHDVPPSYDHLRPFGPICYVSIPSQRREKLSKLEPRAQKACILQCVSKSGTYKVWNLETRKVDVSKDVIFYETQFPSRTDFEQANAPEANAARTNVSDKVNAPMANAPTPQIFDEIIVEKPPPGAQVYTAKEPQK